jgi:hypothetical protein
MRRCYSCGSDFTGGGYECSSCKIQKTIIEENEKNRRQNEAIARHARYQAEAQHAQMENFSRVRNEYQNNMLLEEQRRTNGIIIEEQKRTRIIEELRISEEEAYREGLELKQFGSLILFEKSGPGFFSYDCPYASDKLIRAFSRAAQERIDELFHDSKSWINQVALSVKELGVERRELFLALNSDPPIRNKRKKQKRNLTISFNGVKVECGIVLEADLQIKIRDNSGEAFFVKDPGHLYFKHESLIHAFNDGFKPQEVLDTLNKPKAKAGRLKKVIIKEIEFEKDSIDTIKARNLLISSDNKLVVLGWLLLIVALFLMLPGGLGWNFRTLGSIVIFCIWFALIRSGGGVMLKPPEDLTQHSERLRDLTSKLRVLDAILEQKENLGIVDRGSKKFTTWVD